MLWFYISVPIGLLIVLCAVGIPYWHAHRRLSEPHDLSDGHGYLDAAGKTPEDAATGRPGERQAREESGGLRESA